MAAYYERLKVVALISGGKDSFFSLLHCLANDHEVVALANLYPPTIADTSDDDNDLNSYMYQTAGHALIPLYAHALRLPLYRQEIIGGPANLSKDYHSNLDEPTPTIQAGGKVQEVDETESLLPLLRKVFQAHPTVNAVCSGAILSTYQRTRVESVARRLNLTPLNYLWQYSSLPRKTPGGLLDDLKAVGFDIRIVKVASGGLDEDLLWCNLLDSATREKVERSVKRFGGNVLGEGGEYETLVIDGPIGLFKAGLKVQSYDKRIRRGGGGQAWLGFNDGVGILVKKDGHQALDQGNWDVVPDVLELWDIEFTKLVNHILNQSPTPKFKIYSMKSVDTISSWTAGYFAYKHKMTLILSNLTGATFGTTASEQMSGISAKLLSILTENSHTDANNIVFTTIVLRSMTDFATVNIIYGKLFTLPNPPARVTVACGNTLPPDVKVMASFVVHLGESSAREGLHVQSRSYWAPANIGPYSQAISIPAGQRTKASLVYVAGQIPLLPFSMALLGRDGEENGSKSGGDLRNAEELKVGEDACRLFINQACIALQHLWRIGIATSVGRWGGAVAFIAGKDDPRIQAQVAWNIWKKVHTRELWERRRNEADDSDGIDLWDRTHGGMGSLMQQQSEDTSLPDFEGLLHPGASDIPGFFAVQVDELPRGCPIEWQSLGMTRPYVNVVSYIAITLEEPTEPFVGHQRSEKRLRDKLLEVLRCKDASEDVHVTVYTYKPALICDLNLQIIPCRAVWGDGVRLAAGVVIQKGI